MTRPLLALALVAVLGCATPPRKQRGAPCELNSQCDAPLVCRLAACRIECASTRDCGIGQQCVLDVDGLGACTLDSESHCAMNSDCTAPLVCAATHCVNVCNDARDCHDGALCIDHGCVDPSTNACVRDSECADVGGLHFVCANDQRCRQECLTPRDCRFGTVCDPRSQACVSADRIPDAGAPDSSAPDGGGSAWCRPPFIAFTPGLAAGYGTTCAHVLDQTTGETRAACWGNNDHGQLGNPAAGTSTPYPTLVQLPPGNVGPIALGIGSHGCAIVSDGTLWCWGANDVGQLGDGTTSESHVPVRVTGLTDVRNVAVGGATSCAAVGPTFDVYCWGSRVHGALGDGMISGLSATPLRVGALAGYDLTVGSLTACMSGASFTTTCWGENMNGLVGDGTVFVSHPTPYALTGSLGAPSMGSTHTCALDTTDLWCWGTNFKGELGTPPAMSPLPQLPAHVTTLTDFVFAVDAGDRFTCAKVSTPTGAFAITCWGWNLAGQLGDGTFVDRDAPGTYVIGLDTGANEVVAGSSHACAVQGASGTVLCWGSNTFGELGTPTSVTRNSNVPLTVSCPP